jgi:hypothetical protein
MAKLLRRFHRVTDLSVGSAKFIIPLAIVISLGICNIDGVSLSEEEVFAQALDALGTAIDAGTMSALQILYIWGALKKCGVKALLRGFCRGASPHLHTLYVPFVCFLEPSGSGVNDGEDDDEDRRDWEQTEENVGALAVMLEARKSLGYCAGLKELPFGAFECRSVDIRMRFLCTTFCTLEELVFYSGVLDDQTCDSLEGVIESEQVLVPRLTYSCIQILTARRESFNQWGMDQYPLKM